jgi:hypothetical protein
MDEVNGEAAAYLHAPCRASALFCRGIPIHPAIFA